MAAELRRHDKLEDDFVSMAAADWLHDHRVRDTERGVEASSWDARVPRSGKSVAKSVEEFLSSKLIVSKGLKLRREGMVLGAGERHLYVFVSPTGPTAFAYPRHPADLAINGLSLPDGVDVLWLNTQSQLTYRYSVSDGLEVCANV